MIEGSALGLGKVQEDMHLDKLMDSPVGPQPCPERRDRSNRAGAWMLWCF